MHSFVVRASVRRSVVWRRFKCTRVPFGTVCTWSVVVSVWWCVVRGGLYLWFAGLAAGMLDAFNMVVDVVAGIRKDQT